jgi:DNA-binding winged helix-turn-helix (wHTH) protein
MIRHPMPSACFRFGDFELDVVAYVILRDGARIQLEKMPMDALILLVENAGTLVRRGQIEAALWAPDVFVERDSAINTAIRKIRQALGDDADTPRFIETVVGKGYRFIAPVERRSGARPPFPSYRLSRGEQEFLLTYGQNLLGRDPSAAVYIDHPSVSRQHARISIDADTAVLEDLSSRNGTFLDGRRIEGPTDVRNGAVISLGPIAFTFFVVSAQATTQTMSGGSAI